MTDTVQRNWLRAFALSVTSALSWLWLGIVVGISVIETPIRFRTPPITRSGAAMLGVAVFHALAYVELVLAIIAIAVAIVLRDRWLIAIVAAVVTVAAIEHAFLVPVLAVRAEALVQNVPLEPSSVHAWATACELAKMIALALLGWRSLSMLRQR
jgi:hypothetical protein